MAWIGVDANHVPDKGELSMGGDSGSVWLFVSETGKPSTVMTQSLDELEALELDHFRVFQVALSEIGSRCGIGFPGALIEADSVGERLARRPETLRARKAVNSLAEIDWS